MFRGKLYYILCVFVYAIMFGHTLYGQWGGDFWEHCAVVKELATNPLHPHHPILLIDKSHPFFSPYLLSVGLFAKYTTLSPIASLSIAGMMNLLMLMIGLRCFVNVFVDNDTMSDAASFYFLLFILLLWPANAWDWSGFFHLGVFGYVLPYPSTFACAITFFALSLLHNSTKTTSICNYLLTIFLTSIVIITHPSTATFLLIGVIAITLNNKECTRVKALFIVFSIILLSFVIALLWPYYSFLDLLLANTPDFHKQSITMYQSVLVRTKSFIPFIPLLLWLVLMRVKKNRTDALALMLFGSIAVYMVGYFSGQYGLGRIIAFTGILCQLVLALFMGTWRSAAPSSNLLLKFLGVSSLLWVLILNMDNMSVLYKSYDGYKGIKYSYSDYNMLTHTVGQYDVVLSDLDTSWKIPAFSGKVVASHNPVHWVADMDERRSDTHKFFAKDTIYDEKIVILKRYNVDYLLINKKNTFHHDCYHSLGDIMYDNKSYELIKLKGNGNSNHLIES